MALRVGIDLVSVESVREAIAAHGERYLSRVSTPRELTRSGRADRLAAWPTMALEQIPVRDHTMRPNWAQTRAHAILDRAISAELEREAPYAAESPTLTA
jgi:hypothetical protein